MFDLCEELSFLHDESYSIENEISVVLMNSKQISSLISNLGLDSEPGLVLEAKTWDGCRSFLKHFEALKDEHVSAFGTMLFKGRSLLSDISALGKQIDNTHDDIADNQQQNFELHKKTLELLIFLWHWFFETAEKKSRISSITKKPVKQGAKVKEGGGPWEPKSAKDGGLCGKALEIIQKFLLLNLNSIFISSSERDLVINDMIFKSIRLCLDRGDILKNASSKATIMEIFCHCSGQYESSFTGSIFELILVLSNYLQDFLREENLAEFVAELLDCSAMKYSQKTLLEHVGSSLYNEKDSDLDKKIPKTTAKFLIKVSEIQPKETLKQMVHLNDLLDSESQLIRAAMMDVIGNIIHGHLTKDDSVTAASNLKNFYEIISSRYLDVSPMVRTRVLKNLIRLTQRHTGTSGKTDIPVSFRLGLVEQTAMRLKDKTSMVRKKAIELLTAFIETTPFNMIPHDLESLSEKMFEARANNLMETIKEKLPKEIIADDLDAVPQNDEPESAAPVLSATALAELNQLEIFLKYYQDGLAFSRLINSCCSTVGDLLGSSLKTEVIIAMKFFVTAYRYELEGAKLGVKKMVHKIWDKDMGDKETGSVKDILVTCFYDIHMNPPSGPIPVEKVIATNLSDLVGSMDLAEQTSLEELLSTMSTMDKIPAHLSETLWKIFNSKGPSVSTERKKNALILLGMVGKSDKRVLADNLDILTRVGLGPVLLDDFSFAKYSCIALQQLYHVKRQKGVYKAPIERKSHDHPTCERINALILNQTQSLDWFSFAEQAISSLYIMVEQPDKICEDIIKTLAARLFDDVVDPVEAVTTSFESSFNIASVETPTIVQEEDLSGLLPTAISPAYKLSQLMFVVGHVAIKQIVHLESIESEWKRRKAVNDASPGGLSKSGELDMVTGSAEDDFAETMLMVKERELLFGQNSLLSIFGPMIVHILTHVQKFKDPVLQIMTALSLCKFMCVSSDFCEARLPLLFAVMDRSRDPTMRSNLVIGMGDLAICFNSVIDEDIGQLYNRLRDDDFFVKKNTLMVLTFLILNGMIKVKGQISEMAKCIQDPDPQIQNLAKGFFKELSKKDNAIYNNLPDIISNLSTVEEQDYKSIVKFLFGFIVKDKLNEIIVEKLCFRFKHADTERQWRDIGFCLSLLSFNTEKSAKKLMEHLGLYQDKLYEPSFYKYLTDIAGKLAKGKPDLAGIADDIKERLESAHKKAVEDYSASMEAKNEGVSVKSWKKRRESSNTPRLSLPQATILEKEGDAEGEEENEGDSSEEVPAIEDPSSKPSKMTTNSDSEATVTDDEVMAAVVTKKGAPKKKVVTASFKRAPVRRARRAIVEESDSDSD